MDKKKLISKLPYVMVRIMPIINKGIIPLLILVALLVSWIVFRYSRGEEELIEILPNLITATSIIVAILIGYLFNRLVEIRKDQNEKLDRYIELQEELSPYQDAFSTLAESLYRNYRIDPLWKRDYFELRSDIKFLEDKSKKPYAVLFIRALHRIGENRYEYKEPEISRKLMPPEELDAINECVNHLSGTLCREKWYKHLFTDLGIPLMDFSDVILAHYPGLQTVAQAIDRVPHTDIEIAYARPTKVPV